MMLRSRRFFRTLLALLLIGGCIAAVVAPLLTPAQAAPSSDPSAIPGDLVISQIRFQGPGSGSTADPTNEFIELFNRNCSSAISLQNYVVRAADSGNSGILLYTFPAGASIQPGHYYLLGGPTYSGTGTAAADNTTPYNSPGVSSTFGGVAIFTSASSTTPLDQVGFTGSQYFEGTALTALTDPTRSYTRNTTSSNTYVDSNNNSQDFASGASNPRDSGFSPTVTCGTPTTISGNAQAPNVALTYTGDSGQPSGSVVTDAAGNYVISIPSGWTGTVAPVQTANFTFSPDHIAYTSPVTSSPIDQDYTAVLTAPTSLSILINEVAWMGTQVNANDQWMELYNPNAYGVDVTNLQLIGTGIGSSNVFNLSDAGLSSNVLPGHGFLVLESNAHSSIFSSALRTSYSCNGVTYTTTEKSLHLALSSYGEYIYLRLSTNNLYVDHIFEIPWPAGSNTSASARASMERHNQDLDSTTAWLTFAGTPPCGWVYDSSGSNRVKGSPGEPNWAQSGINPTPIATSTHYKTPTPLPPTPFGHMVINEFLPRAGYDWNQDGTVDIYDEFVEVKNLGPIAAQLGGWKIDVISPGGPSSYILPSQTLQPGQRMVFYRKTTNLALYDSGGTVRLINNRGIIVDARSYGAVAAPDQSTCRIPDGAYWRFPCFPTPGNENSLTGSLPVPPPVVASQPPPCLMADTVPEPFKQAECYGFGADIFNPAYWNDQAGLNDIPVPDDLNKTGAAVQ